MADLYRRQLINTQVDIWALGCILYTMAFFIHHESDFNRGKLNKWFLLLNNQEPFSLAIKKDIPFKELQTALCVSLKEFYGNAVEPGNLRFFMIEKAQEEVVFAWRKVRELEGKEVSASILEA